MGRDRVRRPYKLVQYLKADNRGTPCNGGPSYPKDREAPWTGLLSRGPHLPWGLSQLLYLCRKELGKEVASLRGSLFA